MKPNVTPEQVIRALVAEATDEADRWILRITLLELFGVGVEARTLAIIGGCDEAKAEGVIGAMLARGLVEK